VLVAVAAEPFPPALLGEKREELVQ
jgi:hypothetical protein